MNTNKKKRKNFNKKRYKSVQKRGDGGTIMQNELSKQRQKEEAGTFRQMLSFSVLTYSFS